MKSYTKQRILFVCLGNICRSPSAEACFKKLIDEKGFSEHFEVDSAGTIAAHEGKPADERMRSHAAKRNIDITSISRPVKPEDFEYFDLIIAMDHKNMNDLEAICPPEHAHKLKSMTDYATETDYHFVPDPYFGGGPGFELVLDILEDACQGLLSKEGKQGS